MKQLLCWIRDHKLSTAGLVLVILGCVALVNLSRRVHHLKPRAMVAASVAVTPGEDVNPAPSVQPATEPGARSSRLRSEFEDGGTYLDFIQRALGRPQEGGQFYALLAWRRCSDLRELRAVATVPGGNDAFRDGAAALVEDIARRCTGVLETYPDAQALYKLAMEQRGGRDVLLPPEGRGLVAPAARITANADLDAALKTGDRRAAAEALRDNAGFLDLGNSTGDDGADRQLRQWSAEIVACELVGDCRGGLEASLHCVNTGDCAHDDDRDIVLARVPETQRIVFDTMLAATRERMRLMPGRSDADDKPRP